MVLCHINRYQNLPAGEKGWLHSRLAGWRGHSDYHALIMHYIKRCGHKISIKTLLGFNFVPPE